VVGWRLGDLDRRGDVVERDRLVVVVGVLGAVVVDRGGVTTL